MSVTVVRGHTHDAQRVFRSLEHEGELIVGSQGDWEVTGPGVVALHLRLRFAGSELFAASANGPVLLGGRSLEQTWTVLRDGDELRFGFAMLRVGREPLRSGSVPPVPSRVSREHLGLAIGGTALVLGILIAVGVLFERRGSSAGSNGPSRSASAATSALPQTATPSSQVASVLSVPIVAAPSALQPIDEDSSPTFPLPLGSTNEPVQPSLGLAAAEKLPPAYPQNVANRPIPRIGDKPWLISDEWREHHERLLHAAGRASARLIFLGDSITEGWWSAPSYKEYFGKYMPLNLGIASDTTQNVLWRIEHGALDGTHPQVVVTMVGINNLAGGFSPEDTARGLRAIVAAVQAHLPEARVLLLAVLPARQDPGNPLRQRILDCNKLLQVLAQAGRVEVIDVGSVLLEADGSITKATLRDYLHPTAEGYEKLSQAVAPKLAAMLGG